MSYLEQVEEQLRPMTSLVTDELSGLEQRITELREELNELGKAKTRLTNLLRQLDPDSVPAQKRTQAKRLMSGERYQRFVNWLAEFSESINKGKGIWAADLLNDPSFTIIESKSQIQKALVQAHEDGILRLDSVGQGGRKVYKVVA